MAQRPCLKQWPQGGELVDEVNRVSRMWLFLQDINRRLMDLDGLPMNTRHSTFLGQG